MIHLQPKALANMNPEVLMMSLVTIVVFIWQPASSKDLACLLINLRPYLYKGLLRLSKGFCVRLGARDCLF